MKTETRTGVDHGGDAPKAESAGNVPKEPWQEPKLTFVEPKLTKCGEVKQLTGFFATFPV